MAPFSGKMKKAQLKAKRQRKREACEREKASEGLQEAMNAETDAFSREDPIRNPERDETDARRGGIRSVFRKETREEVEVRRRVNFLPLRDRREMPASGIPFGEWFRMPRHLDEGDSFATRRQKDAGEDEAGVLFPLAVEIPSRGWSPALGGGAFSSEIDVLPNTTLPPFPRANDDKDGPNRDTRSPTDEDPDDEDPKDAVEAFSAGPSLQERIESIERARFAVYKRALEECPPGRSSFGHLPLNLYEQNLDVWRQLWRTVELSEIILLVVDARFVILHLHLGFLFYLTRTAGKPCVVVLNKADLIPKAVLEAWMGFLPPYLRSLGLRVIEERKEEWRCGKKVEAAEDDDDDDDEDYSKCPAPILIRPFTANPVEESAISAVPTKSSRLKKRKGKLYESLRSGKAAPSSKARPENANVGGGGGPHADDEDDEDPLRYGEEENFKGKARAERRLQREGREGRELSIVSAMIAGLLAACRRLARRGEERAAAKPDEERETADKNGEKNKKEAAERTLHVGFVGFPNVGKSSLLNCIGGGAVVSVSATPGHSKHLQTIPLPRENEETFHEKGETFREKGKRLGERVVLVDCPGLVGAMRGVPRALQGVVGSHPIAQTRDPASGVAFLAAHLALERICGLRHPDGEGGAEWSPFEICEAHALRRGFFVRRGKGAPDVHRAAIDLLQAAFRGELPIYLAPPPVEFLKSEQYEKEIKPFLLLRVFEH